MPIIYTLSNPLNNIVYYVGYTTKTIEERLAGHLVCPQSETTEILIKKFYKPIITMVEEGDHVTKETETQWIKKLSLEGCKLENRNGLINYQSREDWFLSEDEVFYLSKLPENDMFKIIINRILAELPIDSSIPIVLRIKNFCETALNINNQQNVQQ